MATINANTVAIYVDAAAGTFSTNPAETQTATPALKPVLYSSSASITVNNATYETNYKKATASVSDAAPSLAPTRAYNVGTTTTSISLEGMASWATLANTMDMKAIFDEVIGKAQVTVCWASTDTNGSAYGGKGFFTSFEISSGVDDFATFSAQIELTGDPEVVA